MKVTGWTHYENPDYIDILEDMTTTLYTVLRDSAVNLELDVQEESDKCIVLKSLVDEIRCTVINDIRNNGYHFSGEDHQLTRWGTPIIDGKYILCMSQRMWGQLIADAFPDEIDNDMGYIEWAWNNRDVQRSKVKIPSSDLWV